MTGLHRLLPGLEIGCQSCPSQMFGGERARVDLAHDVRPRRPRQVTYFQPVPLDSPFWSKGNGQVVQQPKKPKKGHGHGGGGGGNGGNGGGGGGRAAGVTAEAAAAVGNGRR